MACLAEPTVFMQEKMTPQTLSQTRAETENSEARKCLEAFFDAGTFVETNALVERDDGQSYASVVTGYGAVDGALVYAFAQDCGRTNGAIDDRHARKMEALYHLALSNGAPVVGVFDSCGMSIYEGARSLSAFGRILSCVTEASGAIPQIAVLTGPCLGTMAAIASLFDFVIEADTAEFYVSSPLFTNADAAQNDLTAFCGSQSECFAFAKRLLAFLPAVCDAGGDEGTITDDPNRSVSGQQWSEGVLGRVSTLTDAGTLLPIGSTDEAALTAFGLVGGVRCGIIAGNAKKNAGRISRTDARRIARFVGFCDAFDLPLLSLVDSEGVLIDHDNERAYAADLAKVAQAYADADIPLITLLCGKAIGTAYVLFGSKAVGADVVYALPDAEISPVTAEAAVAFVENAGVTSPEDRKEKEKAWRDNRSSALSAARCGEIDDIVDLCDVRAKIASALYMMRGEGPIAKRRRVDAL